VRESTQRQPIAKCANIFNRTDRNVTFEYQFEDAYWRSETLAPGDGVFIWDFAPQNPLRVRQPGSRTYTLETSPIPTHRNAGQPVDPDLSRYDQAAAYTFLSANGQVDLFSGFAVDWYTQAGSELSKWIDTRKSDFAFLKDSIDPEVTDPLFFETDFNDLIDQLESIYAKWMRSQSMPEIELLWEPTDRNVNSRFRPVVVISCCRSTAQYAGVQFLKKTFDRVYPNLVRSVLTVQECYVTSATGIGIAELDSRFKRNGVPDLSAIELAVERDISKNAKLSIEGHKTEGTDRLSLWTEWQHERRSNANYAWRVFITIGLRTEDKKVTAVDLSVKLQAAKNPKSSAKWYPIDDASLGTLGALPDGIRFVDANDSPHGGDKLSLQTGAAISKAATICNQISARIEGLIVDHSKQP